MSQSLRVVGGWVELTEQQFEQMQELRRAERELEWIAVNYKDATPGQQARLDAHLEAIARYEDDYSVRGANE